MTTVDREFLGVSLGDKRTPREPVIQQVYDQSGVWLNPDHVTHLRMGKSGARKIERAAFKVISESQKSPKKDQFYKGILDQASLLSEDPTVDVDLGIGFVETLAEELKPPRFSTTTYAQHLRRITRAMRAELVYSDRKGEVPQGLQQAFRYTAADYFKDFRDPKKTYAHQVGYIARNWDWSIEDFYRLLYENNEQTGKKMSGLVIGSWTVREANMLEKFYAHRLNTGSPLSPVDQVYKDSYYQEGLEVVAGRIGRPTGIPFDLNTANEHLKALFFGEVFNPYKKTKAH